MRGRALAEVVDAIRRRTWARYAVALATVLLATLLKSQFDVVGRDAPVAIYLGAIMTSAWLGGAGPGLFATAVSSLAMAYLFFAPFTSLAVESGEDVVRLVIAAAEGTLISLLAGALRSTSESLGKQTLEVVRVETALKRTKAQLHHVQKVQSLGEFAAGVAHDVNNMITVVLTSQELLERRLGRTDDRALEEARQIRTPRSGSRGSRGSSSPSRGTGAWSTRRSSSTTSSTASRRSCAGWQAAPSGSTSRSPPDARGSWGTRGGSSRSS